MYSNVNNSLIIAIDHDGMIARENIEVFIVLDNFAMHQSDFVMHQSDFAMPLQAL